MYPNSDPGMFWVAFYGCLLAEVIPVPIEVPLSRQVSMSHDMFFFISDRACKENDGSSSSVGLQLGLETVGLQCLSIVLLLFPNKSIIYVSLIAVCMGLCIILTASYRNMGSVQPIYRRLGSACLF